MHDCMNIRLYRPFAQRLICPFLLLSEQYISRQAISNVVAYICWCAFALCAFFRQSKIAPPPGHIKQVHIA